MTMADVADFGNPGARYALAKWLVGNYWRAYRALTDYDPDTYVERKEALVEALKGIGAAASELWDSVCAEGLPELEPEIQQQRMARWN
jgi:hypothetical protein